MDAASQRDRDRRFLWGVLAAAVPFAAVTALLLTSIFGPSDIGVQCTRERGAARRCEVLQSRFLGLAGNSAFAIAESEIAGARAVCAPRGVGGRGGPACTVNLLLKSGRYRSYPVLSYPLIGQAQTSARRLNDYLADPAQSSIVLKDRIGSALLLAAGLPLLTIAIVWMLRRRRGRRLSPV